MLNVVVVVLVIIIIVASAVAYTLTDSEYLSLCFFANVKPNGIYQKQ